MTELTIELHLNTATASVRDVVCRGECRHQSPVECAQSTFLVFPYRGVYVRHVGRHDSVAESNQVVFFNRGEDYRISHPVQGGDACLSVSVAEHLFDELFPQELVRSSDGSAFRRQRLRIDARTQALVADRLVSQQQDEKAADRARRGALAGARRRGRRSG